MYLFSDYGLYTIIAILTALSIWAYITLKHCREYIWARIQEVYRGKTRYLTTDETSSCRWKADYPFRGGLRTRIADYYLIDPPLRGEGVFYVIFRGFSFNVGMDKAAAVSTLEGMHLNSIAQALLKYDDEYRKKPGADDVFNSFVEEEIAKQPKFKELDEATLKLLKIKMAGMDVLMSLKWVTPFTIPLNRVYNNWCLKRADAQTNKHSTDALLDLNNEEWLKKMEKNKVGIPLGTMVFYICMLLVCAAIALYIFSMVQGQHQGQIPGQDVVNAVQNATNIIK